ncbi:MAG: FAD-dependent oxidoreductase [Actinomycetota bacterium]|nr:FAD-dependent oxidoreductase [Actinomycetota bacterium]
MPEVMSSEVVVIGGGVIGAAIAYYLCKEGAEVMIVEEEDLASGASGACDGFVSLQTKQPGAHLELARESAALFSSLAEDLDDDIEYNPCGGMMLATTQEQLKELKARAKKLQAAGLEVEMLTPSDLKSRLPEVGGDIKGASYCAQDAQVNPIALTLGLARKAQEMGATILQGTRVENIVVTNNRVREVHTSGGSIHSRRVVCAAGRGSNQIGKMIIVDIPVMPQRGQILVTEARERMLDVILYGAEYLGTKGNIAELMPRDEEAVKLGLGFTAEQTASGNFLLGSTREFAGADASTTPEAMNAIARNAMYYLPWIKELDVIRSFAGLRPCSPDGLPILGTVKGVRGFFIATGHSGDGICLAPVTGKLLSELVLDGETSLDIEPFSLYRFK